MADLFDDVPVLETSRLLLRKVEMSFVDDFFEYLRDPEIEGQITWYAHRSIEDTRLFLSSILQRYENHQPAPWAILHRADRKAIGMCGFFSLNAQQGLAEVAYNLSRKYWRKGYMQEALREVISFGFTALNLKEIEARCETENLASAGVLEKVGMKFRGKNRIIARGAYREWKHYSILRSEFES